MLDACAAATANHVGTGVCVVFLHGFGADFTHQGTHQWFQLTNRAAFTIKIATAIFVHQAVVLAVIVPDRIRTHINDGIGQVLFPKCASLGAGKIPKCTITAPPSANAVGILVVAVLYKDTSSFKIRKIRVAQQDARFDVGHVLGMLLFHGA